MVTEPLVKLDVIVVPVMSPLAASIVKSCGSSNQTPPLPVVLRAEVKTRAVSEIFKFAPEVSTLPPFPKTEPPCARIVPATEVKELGFDVLLHNTT